MKKADTTRKYVTTKKYNKLVDEIERLQEQLDEASMFVWRYWELTGNYEAGEFLKKWGYR